MRKISIRNLFKKSESDKGKKKNKILIPLLIILLMAGIVYLGYPLVFPDSSIKLSSTPAKGVIAPSSTVASTNIETIPEVKEKTEFDIELENRKLSYEDKIFVYEPYMPPSNRNPFQKVSTSYYLGETEEKPEEGILLNYRGIQADIRNKLSRLSTIESIEELIFYFYFSR